MTPFQYGYQQQTMGPITSTSSTNNKSDLAAIRTTLSGWTILIVDDQPDNLMIAKVALEFQGAKVSIAANGEEGLPLLATIQPTLVLLDLSMPKMDGWEMLRRIRAQPETSRIPVIALTAHAMDGDRERVMDAGFDGYISKPFDVMTLPSEIQQALATHALHNKDGAAS